MSIPLFWACRRGVGPPDDPSSDLHDLSRRSICGFMMFLSISSLRKIILLVVFILSILLCLLRARDQDTQSRADLLLRKTCQLTRSIFCNGEADHETLRWLKNTSIPARERGIFKCYSTHAMSYRDGSQAVNRGRIPDGRITPCSFRSEDKHSWLHY